MENLKLEASERKLNTKGDLKKLRLEGFLPGILYGDKEQSLPLSVKKISIKKMLESSNFMSSVIEMSIGGSKRSESKPFSTPPADTQETSCSLLGPPQMIAITCLLTE